ncbi:DEAD/DEAH box helicase [Microlunatus sp. Y2014]|uniref:DEAD/DEAH box helicase n=1 Tax=Microlunatus sp. Y2014 TaxID=3418488 RepID=UPI003DA74830
MAPPAVPTWPAWLAEQGRVRQVRTVAARRGRTAGWPDWLPAPVVNGLMAYGFARPWQHQRQAADVARAGGHVVLATGTASGKSLGYLLPILAATHPAEPNSHDRRTATVRAMLTAGSRRHTALYLSPTKALAHDQLRAARELKARAGSDLGFDGWRVGALDGDSGTDDREFARSHAGFVLSNPDMLHASVLPSHPRWASFLGSLRYVVVDESHRYRGVFGAHVGQVLRRLRRLCAHYGADPVFVLASATGTDPATAAGQLVGVEGCEFTVVDDDASPHASVTHVLAEAGDDLPGVTAQLLADLGTPAEGTPYRQTVAFLRSRKLCEVVSLRARELAAGRDLGELSAETAFAAYRGGYLATERRALEAALTDGRLRGVAATNALELGVDIAGLDAVVIAGMPSTMASYWQQAGRAGRRDTPALVVALAGTDQRDAYLLDHPEMIFDHPVERTVLHPDNPYVLGPHLAAAAQELPLRADDEGWFGPTTVELAERLERQGALRRRGSARAGASWYWTRPDRAVDLVNLRTQGGRGVQIVEQDTGRVIGLVDTGAADAAVHEGAVYLHQGQAHLVLDLDHEEGLATVRTGSVGWTTQPLSTSTVSILTEDTWRTFGNGFLHRGDVEVTSQVTGYLRRDELTGEVWDRSELDLPVRRLRTRAVWWTIPSREVAGSSWTQLDLASAAHGAEHTAIGLLGLFVPGDRWDVGGLSTVLHPDTGELTVFVHDGAPGGAGFADRAYEVADRWWAATAERLRTCPCTDGCPACVISPKCGNANEMLDKHRALDLVTLLLAGDHGGPESRDLTRR